MPMMLPETGKAGFEAARLPQVATGCQLNLELRFEEPSCRVRLRSLLAKCQFWRFFADVDVGFKRAAVDCPN